jgi:hypothetical protein
MSEADFRAAFMASVQGILAQPTGEVLNGPIVLP